jgi:hypothetical protein
MVWSIISGAVTFGRRMLGRWRMDVKALDALSFSMGAHHRPTNAIRAWLFILSPSNAALGDPRTAISSSRKN